jgi:hypothetical protein
VNGEEVLETALELNAGQMELSTQENGRTTKPMDKESSLTSTVTPTKDSGLMIKRMDSASILM